MSPTPTSPATSPASVPTRAAALPPRGLRTLTLVEARLFLRDASSTFFALVFPTVLLVGVGLAIPGMQETLTEPGPWAGLQVIHLYAPVVLATAMATPALTTLPVALATYREQGILRRLSTTPMRPQGVLVAQVVVNLVALVVAAGLALVIARVVFGLPAPEQAGTAALSFVVGGAAMFGVGLVIAALAPRAGVASGIGMLVYFPMLFFAGMWTPGPVMPDVVQSIGAYTPLGAASQALSTAWFEGGFPALQLLVMAGYVAVLYPLAARLFRWS